MVGHCDLLQIREQTSCIRKCYFLPFASFCGAPYRVDEAGVVKSVCKAGCVVGTCMQIANKMKVDLSDVDGGTHEPTRDRGFLGCQESDVRCQLEITSLESVGVVTGEAE